MFIFAHKSRNMAAALFYSSLPRAASDASQACVQCLRLFQMFLSFAITFQAVFAAKMRPKNASPATMQNGNYGNGANCGFANGKCL